MSACLRRHFWALKTSLLLLLGIFIMTSHAVKVRQLIAKTTGSCNKDRGKYKTSTSNFHSLLKQSLRHTLHSIFVSCYVSVSGKCFRNQLCFGGTNPVCVKSKKCHVLTFQLQLIVIAFQTINCRRFTKCFLQCPPYFSYSLFYFSYSLFYSLALQDNELPLVRP